LQRKAEQPTVCLFFRRKTPRGPAYIESIQQYKVTVCSLSEFEELQCLIWQIMERLENKMQAFEETAEVQRQEIEMSDKVLEDFEDWIETEKNEGMFFKSLGKVKSKKKIEIKVKAKVEAQKVKEIAKETAASKTRINIYLGLMAILGLTIANAVFATPEVEWRKVAALGLIFIGLVAQVIYEQDISPPKAEETEKKEE
jgi:hypothetical protein